MVFFEAVVILAPTMRKEQLQSTLKTFCVHILKNGGVVRKVSNEGVMRLHRGMYPGPVEKRRMYVPRKHEWRIHEPVDEKLMHHGRYVVMLFDSSILAAQSLQSLVDGNANTLEWILRQRQKHHPLAAFKDPHDFEIGHDMQSLAEEETRLSQSHKGWEQWKSFQGRRWSEYLTQQPNTSEVALSGI
ncbi:hypothetical protein DIPPA_25887 [Diplonema papillatum]|nr:hypothetical protein DIPPA_25887 [Diplonema papillatum]